MTVALAEKCKACDGIGRQAIKTGRTSKLVKCRACKGKPVVQTIPETVWDANAAYKLPEAQGS